MEIGKRPGLLVEAHRFARSPEDAVGHSRQQQAPKWFAFGEGRRQVLARIAQQGHRSHSHDVGGYRRRSKYRQFAEGLTRAETQQAVVGLFCRTQNNLDLAIEDDPEGGTGLTLAENGVALGEFHLFSEAPQVLKGLFFDQAWGHAFDGHRRPLMDGQCTRDCRKPERSVALRARFLRVIEWRGHFRDPLQMFMTNGSARHTLITGDDAKAWLVEKG